MKKRIVMTAVLALALVCTGLTGCAGKSGEPTGKTQVAVVTRGDLTLAVTADGNLVMPHEVRLRFGTPGTVEKIYVEEGDRVKEGTLLAKLDDTAQKIAIASAQYDLQSALNNLSETISASCCVKTGFPRRYRDSTALNSMEQAQDEVTRAAELLREGDYEAAVEELRITWYDIEATANSLRMLLKNAETSYDITHSMNYASVLPEEYYPNATKSIELLGRDGAALNEVQRLIEEGDYTGAQVALSGAAADMDETYRLVRSSVGQIEQYGVSTPDTATTLDYLEAAQARMEKLQRLLEQGDYGLEFAETLRRAQHDLEMGHAILESNEVVFEHGLNLQSVAQYNINVQKAMTALDNYKDELMKTEILAPFDGTVVDIGVKENDQLSSFDYSSITAVHLVDTGTVKLDGFVDEIDIFKVELGQKAEIVVDAIPEAELYGTVTFISPNGTEETGVVNFAVTIALDPTDIELKGGLTATANILVENNENVLLIPNRAVRGSHGDYWVDVVVNEETMETERRTIVPGAQSARYTEVVSGLQEGEKVLEEVIESSSGFFGG
jgi:multidrug efflux pump subunit AcrA (membrane-fusion protein)